MKTMTTIRINTIVPTPINMGGLLPWSLDGRTVQLSVEAAVHAKKLWASAPVRERGVDRVEPREFGLVVQRGDDAFVPGRGPKEGSQAC